MKQFFPFSELHPNAGALLRKEILLLPDEMRNPNFGGVSCTDQPVTIDPGLSSAAAGLQEENLVQNYEVLPREYVDTAAATTDDLNIGSEDDSMIRSGSNPGANSLPASVSDMGILDSPRGGRQVCLSRLSRTHRLLQVPANDSSRKRRQVRQPIMGL